jgi:hypothetical protein
MRLRRGQQRTFWSILLRTLIPRAVVFAAVAAALLVGQVMAVNPSSAPIDSQSAAVPVWTPAIQAAHPGCVPSAQWPAGKPAASERIAFDTAWSLNHDNSESNDVWVLGVCP